MDKREYEQLKSKFVQNVSLKLIALVIAGIASYLFYFIMVRMLSVEDYGLLYSIIALTYILTVPHETIRTVMAKYTVELAAKKEYGKIKGLFFSSIKRIMLYSVIVFFIFLVLSPLIMNVLHAPFASMMIIAAALLVAFVLPVVWGSLQGLQYFGHLGLNNSIETAVKLLIAITLVYIGFGVNGALIAIPVSMVVAFFAGFWPLRKVMKKKAEKFRFEPHILKYSLATFVIMAFFVAMYSVDVIAVRYFFSAKSSGLYGGIAVIGRVLIFISIAITRVMFSAVAEHHGKTYDVKGYLKARKVLYMAMASVLAVDLAFLAVSIFAPQAVISLVLGSNYLEAAPLLKYMIIAMGALALSSLIIFYNLSINWSKRLTARILGTFVFIEIILFFVFSHSLREILIMIMSVNVLLFLALCFTLLLKKHKEKV